jgi:Phage-related protein
MNVGVGGEGIFVARMGLRRVPSSTCTYVRDDISLTMTTSDKLLAWLRGEVETPPFSRAARVEAGELLRRLQQGEKLALPQSRPMPGIGPRRHELRIRVENRIWRIIYRIDGDAIIAVDVVAKTTGVTPQRVIEDCQRRSLADAGAEER